MSLDKRGSIVHTMHTHTQHTHTNTHTHTYIDSAHTQTMYLHTHTYIHWLVTHFLLHIISLTECELPFHIITGLIIPR